ncbi:hypothetical protein GXC69_07245 [Candidatus Macondimonas diazotrophica]|nr:hypothetical protein [Candidatus Macondimonas diazotrophica]HBG30933.1 hypothetical protein [Gammaproteobacteria bacterium]
MALELIGAGYGRTGTDSTKEALNILGLRCYHMREVIGNPDNAHHVDFWCRVAKSPPGTAHDWAQVFAGYRAAIDNPAACVWRELMDAYPDAKVLLTVHPGGAEAWYDSVMETIYFTERLWQWRVLEAMTPFARKFGPMARTLIWQRFHKGTMPDRSAAIAEYHRHIAAVKAEVPADRLLLFNVADGWAPLCAFLGMPVPEQPFPRVNDRDAIKRDIRGMVRGAYVILAIGAAVVLGVAWAASRLV